jgi:holo-[acyl-carrier protein] synthase
MTYGIGVDIVRIDRLQRVVDKWGQKFLKRIYTDGEITYCFRKKNPYFSLAARFAAKEAFMKALGTGIPISFTDIEVINTGAGKPSFIFSEKIGIHLSSKNIACAHLSLSHDHDYALATVILER